MLFDRRYAYSLLRSGHCNILLPPASGPWGIGLGFGEAGLVNHIVVGALMFAFGALVTFSAACAVQDLALSRQVPAAYNPVAEKSLVRAPFEYRKRSSDCESPLWPQAGVPSKLKQQ